MIFACFRFILLSLLISSCRCVLPGVGEPVCVPAAGPANPAQCSEIIAKQMPLISADPRTRYTFRQGEAAGCTGSFPAYFRRKNCLVVVNTLDTRLIASGDWTNLRIQVKKLIDTCAGENYGAGGHLRMANGLYIALWNPRSYVAMLRSTGGTVPACMDSVRSNGVDWSGALTQKLQRRNESSETD